MSDQLTTERLREVAASPIDNELRAIAAELLAKREECEAVGRHRDQLLELARLDNETAREAVLSGRENKFRFGAMTTRDAIAEVVQQRDAARTEAEKLRAELAAVKRQRDELVAVAADIRERVRGVRILYDHCKPLEPLRVAIDCYEDTAKQIEALAASQPAQQPKPADGDKCEGGHDAIGIAFTADDVWLCKECLDGCDVEPKP